jgi:hypothetical protein
MQNKNENEDLEKYCADYITDERQSLVPDSDEAIKEFWALKKIKDIKSLIFHFFKKACSIISK